jgi:poly-gamma-glutamate synthesis protein (capsule biosynthesis protein)
MKEFLIPFSILLIAFITYFLFIGKGAFFLPTKDLVSHQKIGQISVKPTDAALETKEQAIGEYTLESIFKLPHQLPVRSGLPVISVIATGDVIPARSVNYQINQRKDFTWPYLKTVEVLKSADITFINLETPLIKNCPLTQEGMSFCGDSRNIEGLVYAGVDVASLANNHAGNKGKAGVEETIKGLEKVGIKSTGANNNPAIVEVRGIKFAFLGYNDIEKTPVVTSADEGKMEKEINEARRKADVVVVQFHWGTEYQTEVEERQKQLGHLAIDLGADLVIGNHPHWIKPVEKYKGKFITYAHGNFVFDQEWSQKTKEGVVGKYIFIGKKLVDIEYLPVEIKDYGQPYFLEGEKKQQILDQMYEASKQMKPDEIR